MAGEPTELGTPSVRPGPLGGISGAIRVSPSMTRMSSLLTVDGARPSSAAICRIDRFVT